MSPAQDVIIIGAPRSGTNMLRDVLASLSGFATWPCDEINLAWRHGNRDYPSDELKPEDASPGVAMYFRDAFDKLRRRTGASRIVEKTCANSLRVEFVHEVVPDARYLFITRDGLDAAVSAMQRWHAPIDVRYTVAKARYVPLGDVPYYGTRFVMNHWRRRAAPRAVDKPPGWWGPKPHDWLRIAAERPLDEVATIQWRRCVDASRRGLSTIPDRQVHHVVYEDFVRDPVRGLRSVLGFLGEPESFDPTTVSGVRASSIGKGRAALSDRDRARLTDVAGSTLEALGYAT